MVELDSMSSDKKYRKVEIIRLILSDWSYSNPL